MARYPHGFLLRRAAEPMGLDDETADAESGQPSFKFATDVLQRDEAVADVLEDGEGALDPLGWIVVPIAKRAGQPFPNRISVGRARNCDIVLRFAGVSKLHAHVHLAPDAPLQLAEYRSANGTFVNGQKLASGESVTIAPGDKVRFGGLEFEVATATAVFDLLMRLPEAGGRSDAMG